MPTSRCRCGTAAGLNGPCIFCTAGRGNCNGVVPGDSAAGRCDPDRTQRGVAGCGGCGDDCAGVAGHVHSKPGRVGRRVFGAEPAGRASVLGTGLPGGRKRKCHRPGRLFLAEKRKICFSSSTAPECGDGVVTRVTVQLGDLAVAADFAGPQAEFEGLDQINIKLPRALAGKGEVSVRAEVDGLRSNSGWLTFR